MSRESTKRKRWKDIPLGRKVLLAVGSIMLLMLGINIILYSQVNKTIRRMDTVYSSNVDLKLPAPGGQAHEEPHQHIDDRGRSPHRRQGVCIDKIPCHIGIHVLYYC